MGNLVVFLGVAMGTGLAGTGLVPVSQSLARTSSCGQADYIQATNELIGEDLGVIIRLVPVQ